MLPPTGGKMVYLVRDGKDVVTSFFHHLTHQSPEDGGFTGTFDEFFDQWIAGQVAFGRWDVHISKWKSFAAIDPRVLILTYEEMKDDLAGCVSKINTHCDFGLSDDTVAALLPRFTFDSMKANVHKFSPQSVKMLEKGDGFEFIRKGDVGDHKILFTDEHHQRYAKAMAKRPP
jgi:hypothetical protein